ncbi:adenylate kinase [Clostridium isatidis]|uniref:adenylate kinase n=1 Tax=Clostridium isatidis TaxID=182773 RepID=UPI003AADDA27
MKKIIIIGSPGAGKSTFARALSKKTEIPVTYIDRLFWNDDKSVVAREILEARIREVISKKEWIIDGNYKDTLPMRLEACDKVFLLDYPLEVCLEGIASRIGTVREDFPWIEEELHPEFLKFVKDFHKEYLPEIYLLLKKYQDKDITIFKSREEAEEYLKSLK